MMRKITIAIDSFKGSLSSIEAAEAIEEGIRSLYPACEIECIAISDGGEGWIDSLLSNNSGGERHTLRVNDPLGRPIDASYAVTNREAIIELAAASGLPLLLPAERNPLKATTYGTGELILHALKMGYRSIVLGIGGSATHDAGMGLLEALGYRFYDHQGDELHGCGEALSQVAYIDDRTLHPILQEGIRWRIACDVTTPLVGPEGAAHLFSPQKGADRAMVEQLERGSCHWAEILHRYSGVSYETIATTSGGGAAGGVGATMCYLLGGELMRGIEVALDAVRFRERAAGSYLIITGEGRIDQQTDRGKVANGVLRAGNQLQIPVVALCGSIAANFSIEGSGYRSVRAITPPDMPLHVAMQRTTAQANLRQAIREELLKLSDLSSRD